MNSEEANQYDMVDYLNYLGHQPVKIRNKEHWYLSPLRNEKEASFTVHRSKNVWYDHGIGKGGKLIDFLIEYYRCDFVQVMTKLSSLYGQRPLQEKPLGRLLNNYGNVNMNEAITSETAIQIISAKQPITEHILNSYLKKRNIDLNLANKYCHEVTFKFGAKEKTYRALGFKNNAGGFELRNEYFKGSSSPKFISYLDNKASSIAVFEGFFDFLSYQTMHKGQEQEMTNFLILNSLAFFERSLLLMEKHRTINLYLDHDNAGLKCTENGLKRSPKFQDESKLYKGYKDLNDWIMNVGKGNRQGLSLKGNV